MGLRFLLMFKVDLFLSEGSKSEAKKVMERLRDEADRKMETLHEGSKASTVALSAVLASGHASSPAAVTVVTAGAQSSVAAPTVVPTSVEEPLCSPRLNKAARRHVELEAQGILAAMSPWQRSCGSPLSSESCSCSSCCLGRELKEANAEAHVQRYLVPRQTALDERSSGAAPRGLCSILRGKSGRSSRVDSHGHVMVIGCGDGLRCSFLEQPVVPEELWYLKKDWLRCLP